MLSVHPVPDDIRPCRAVALGSFVLVMREAQIYSSGMDIDTRSEEFQGHCAAFGMPTRVAHTPWCVPDQLGTGIWCLLPQCPVRVESLDRVGFNIELVSGSQVFESVAADGPVLGEGSGVEEH